MEKLPLPPMGMTICAEGSIKYEKVELSLADVKSHWRDHYTIYVKKLFLHKILTNFPI